RRNVPRVRSIRRWALLLSCATAAVSYALGAHLVALVSAIGAGLLAAPLLCNGAVIAFRTVAGWYHRRCARLHNPLLDSFQEFYSRKRRSKYPPMRVMRKYSWGVPTREALELIASQGPIVE